MTLWKRKVLVLLCACGLAAVMGLLANAANLSLAAVDAIGAVLVAFVVFTGVPWAFDLSYPTRRARPADVYLRHKDKIVLLKFKAPHDYIDLPLDPAQWDVIHPYINHNFGGAQIEAPPIIGFDAPNIAWGINFGPAEGQAVVLPAT